MTVLKIFNNLSQQ